MRQAGAEGGDDRAGAALGDERVQCGSGNSWATKSATRTCGGCGPRRAGSVSGPTVTRTLTSSRERHQRLGATEGRGAEDALDERGHAPFRCDGGQVTDRSAERRVGLGPARAHLPRPQTAPARLGGALDSGGDDNVVARSFCGACDRQERKQVAVRRPRGNQDPHAVTFAHRDARRWKRERRSAGDLPREDGHRVAGQGGGDRSRERS